MIKFLCPVHRGRHHESVLMVERDAAPAGEARRHALGRPRDLVVGRDMRGALQPDDGAESRGVLMREIERDAAADRAAHHHRLVELERIGDFQDHLDVAARGELVFLVLIALRRRRLAVPRHVEHDDAIVVGDALVVEQAAILPAVRAGGVQAEQRNALAGLLDVEPVRAAEQREIEIAADDGLEMPGSRGLLPQWARRARP